MSGTPALLRILLILRHIFNAPCIWGRDSSVVTVVDEEGTALGIIDLRLGHGRLAQLLLGRSRARTLVVFVGFVSVGPPFCCRVAVGRRGPDHGRAGGEGKVDGHRQVGE